MIAALVRIRLLETLAYRAEFLLWLVTLTMPLVMLVFWRSVAQDGAFHGYTPEDFNVYYLAVLVCTLLTNCNSVWEVNEDIRTGELSFWLMRPVHPFVNYMTITFAELGLGLLVALPVFFLALGMGGDGPPREWLRFALLPPALLGGLLINQAIHLLIGSLGFWIERSLVVHKLYATASAVLSGYMFPLAFLPDRAKDMADLLPFRFVIALPVELFTGKVSLDEAIGLMAWQALLVAVLFAAALLVWRRGVRRYSAFG
ncbi:ABC transporter permease [Paludibacterium paludis]|uniref:ABC transporter permease n=1 Tax=Paludibacterium paludis TaxID=1225769 RepID=A0A918P6W7_9NEIS|nr:ABC-2 family transporter protein [Paludibacterium paludis]GGY24560.1 ABC transporter permease [Paludibacterium paludis]